MSNGYAILIILCLVALYSLFLNLKVIGDNPFMPIRLVCTILFAFSALRYLTLMVYGDFPSYSQLVALRWFYFATSIGLTIPTASAVWYVTPFCREKIKYPYYVLAFLPWISFYLYLIFKQPTRIMQGTRFGYTLALTPSFPFYLGVAQGSFVLVMVILCCIGLFKYKNMQLRAQLFLIILAQILLLVDGLSYNLKLLSLPPFTLSEAFGFFAIYYSFSKPIKEMKGICNE